MRNRRNRRSWEGDEYERNQLLREFVNNQINEREIDRVKTRAKGGSSKAEESGGKR